MTVCPSCGEENPERAKFCLECGAPLVAVGLTPVQERRIVTVLFCDVVGFTAASERADPEDVRTRMEAYYRGLQPVVESFGGSVEKLIGDAVMAVFGVPLAHEDDAERAVRAGLAIVDAVGELNVADPTLELAVRVGINTGEVLVSLGAGGVEGEVLGDAVNTAARLQSASPVNAVVVSERTYRATERVFDWEHLQPVSAKGKAEPLRVYRPLMARARFGSDVTRTHAAPLVGRELERQLLVGTFERAAAQQSCQLMAVVGEPGVGKSRLCAELFGYIEQRPGLVTWRQGRCLPYGEGVSFWALGEIVKAECGILESDSPERAAAKLARAVPESEQDRPWLLARLAPLVGAPSEPAGQEESFTAWRRFLEGLSAKRPAVLVFEDLHWGDPALLAFLDYLADRAEGVPLLVLCTARPELYEQHPTFGANARNTQRISLASLTDEETARLVASLLERAVLPAETQQLLLERAGGNPLYAEEFVRLLADRDELGADTAVPESVQALIAARLDTLSPERKRLLQDASVLGAVFWAGALAQMGERDQGAVEQALHELARKELVRPSRTSTMEAEVEYGFWHVLVRDVAYGQIPRAARAARHEAAATWLEERAGQRAEDLADVLAHHYESALELSRAAGISEREEQLQAKAVRYLAMAGARTLSLDVDRAERQLARALELSPRDDPARASLLERWANAVQQQSRLVEATEVLGQAIGLYREQHDAVGAGRALTRLGNVSHRLGDPQCEEMFAEAIELLEAQPPGAELVAAYTYWAGRGLFTDDPQRVLEGSEKALALAADLGLPEPAFALHIRGLARGGEEGIEDLRRALRLALEQGLGRETAVIRGNLDSAVWASQGPQAALDACGESIAFCERRGIADVRLQHLAGVPILLAELGRTEQALAEADLVAGPLEASGDMARFDVGALRFRLLAERGSPDLSGNLGQSVDAARETHLPGVIATTLAAAAQLLLAGGQAERARAHLRELDDLGTVNPWEFNPLLRIALALDDLALAERLAGRLDDVSLRGQHARLSARAQLAEARGDHAAAAHLYLEAAEGWQEFGNVPERAYALLGRGRCLHVLAKGEAEESLRIARELFVLMGYQPALTETETLLASGELAAS